MNRAGYPLARYVESAGACWIRAAHRSEAAILSDLALRSKATWGYSDAFMAACRPELTYTAEQIASASFTFWVADVDGACLGFYALKHLAPGEIELEALFVEPLHIGMGFGRMMMKHACREAAKSGAAALIVQSDPHAEDFYRSAGASLVGRRQSGSIDGRYLSIFVIDLTENEVS